MLLISSNILILPRMMMVHIVLLEIKSTTTVKMTRIVEKLVCQTSVVESLGTILFFLWSHLVKQLLLLRRALPVPIVLSEIKTTIAVKKKAMVDTLQMCVISNQPPWSKILLLPWMMTTPIVLSEIRAAVAVKKKRMVEMPLPSLQMGLIPNYSLWSQRHLVKKLLLLLFLLRELPFPIVLSEIRVAVVVKQTRITEKLVCQSVESLAMILLNLV
jgi:hypothetical protein